MTTLFTKSTSVAIALGSILLTAAPSFADSCNWFHFHPRRAEVMRRDAFLRREINGDRGYLRGHFGQLMREDRGILRQEQLDARRNGGFITPWQQSQLNREENALRRQINYDHRGW